MRKLSLSMALAFGLASTLSAQAPMPWTSEIGVKLNYTVTTINDQDVTTIGIPSAAGLAGVGGVAGLYGVIPVGGKFAVEPSLGLQDLGIAGTNATTANVAARLLYSAWRGLYIGAGPSVALYKQDGDQETILGGQVGVGYRFHLTGSLQGRAEVYYETQEKSDLVLGGEDASSIGLQLGLGFTPGAEPARRGRGDNGMWGWAMGLQGGYAHTSGDGFELTSLSLPGAQNAISLVGGGFPLPGVAPLFVQIPVSERIALEPSVGYSSVKIESGGKLSSYSLGLRADYAFNRTFYAALSGDYTGFGGDLDIDATTGFGVAAGVRFPLVAGLNGRTELSWRDLHGDDGFIGDYTVTGLTFAVTAPIK